MLQLITTQLYKSLHGTNVQIIVGGLLPLKGKALKKEKTEELGAGASNYRGKDGALYTFEIFMRDGASARSRRDRAGKADPRAPIVYNNAGLPNAIIPPNHKLMLLCTRLATHPSQYIKRGKYVLFKFYVDGEALSEVYQRPGCWGGHY